MEITRDDLQTLKVDLLRELGGRLDAIDNRLRQGDRRIQDHEVRLVVLEKVEPTPALSVGAPAGDWPWKTIVGLLSLLTLLAQGLVRIAEAVVARL